MVSVIGVRLDPTSYAAATSRVLEWVQDGVGHYLCAANVHMLMEAHDSSDFRAMLNAADLIVPDGMPLVWMMRLKGISTQQRVYGPTLMLKLLEMAAVQGIPVGLLGSTPDVLADLKTRLTRNLPRLDVAFSVSPPFRALSAAEDDDLLRSLRSAGVRILFVGLGCPKQERWMAEHRDKLDVVMVGVGAAFDFHAGRKRQAPPWVQRMGLEWLFRFFQEPGRLWKRYLYNNPRFVMLVILEWLGLLRYPLAD